MELTHQITLNLKRLRLPGNLDPSTSATSKPSMVSETFSLVAREALANGTPVTATNVGATPEVVIDGDNGSIFLPMM